MNKSVEWFYCHINYLSLLLFINRPRNIKVISLHIYHVLCREGHDYYAPLIIALLLLCCLNYKLIYRLNYYFNQTLNVATSKLIH